MLRAAPSLVAILAAAMVGFGGGRLVADFTDLPANGAVPVLWPSGAGGNGAATRVRETRRVGIATHATAERWAEFGRALMTGADADPDAAADAFASSLSLSPGNGLVWAEFSFTLKAAGIREKADAARRRSERLAPHDPLAGRLRNAVQP